MTRVLFNTVLLFCLLCSAPALSQQNNNELHIASFNIHYITPNRADDGWTDRKQAVIEVLQDIDADVIAFQEMETFVGGSFSQRNLQLEWIEVLLTRGGDDWLPVSPEGIQSGNRID